MWKQQKDFDLRRSFAPDANASEGERSQSSAVSAGGEHHGFTLSAILWLMLKDISSTNSIGFNSRYRMIETYHELMY